MGKLSDENQTKIREGGRRIIIKRYKDILWPTLKE
jgi:hypothetical protein